MAGNVVATRGWQNPRRHSLEGDQGSIIAEVLDSLEQYLNGSVYATSLTMAGNTFALTWNGTELRVLINGVDRGKVTLTP